MCPNEARLNVDSGKIQSRNSIPIPGTGSTQDCVWVITVPENQVVAYKVHENDVILFLKIEFRNKSSRYVI